MAGFRLFTDNHTRQPIVKALRDRGWDTVRAIDVFPEKTPDAVLFAHAAEQGRTFATCDEGVHVIAMQWLQAGRTFRMVFWKHAHHARMSDGDLSAPSRRSPPNRTPSPTRSSTSSPSAERFAVASNPGAPPAVRWRASR